MDEAEASSCSSSDGYSEVTFAMVPKLEGAVRCPGDLLPLVDRQDAPTTFCMAPFLAVDRCHELRDSAPFRPDDRIRGILCHPMSGVVKVGAALPTADPNASCPSGRPGLVHTQPRPLTYCILRPVSTAPSPSPSTAPPPPATPRPVPA